MTTSNHVQIVGILNVTPDSFSDGSKYFDPKAALAHAHQLDADGADIIDVGAESTNPKSEPLTADEEWQRLEPVLGILCKEFPGRISVDTYHASTARQALELGATFVNDVTMFRDLAMVDLAAEYAGKAKYIVGHLSPAASSIAGAHKTNPTTSVVQVKNELLAKRQELIDRGVPADNIILDPDIGFGKSLANDHALNWQLLEFAREVPGIPVMLGCSRKRFLGEDRMKPSTSVNAAKIAVASGAQYLRVHDVVAHRAAF
jgi:dihydropteroate synthase